MFNNKKYAYSQPKHGSIEKFLKLVTNIWYRDFINKLIKNALLIFDKAGSHFSSNNTFLFNQYNSKYGLIPEGMAGFLQPLDLCINKPFKN